MLFAPEKILICVEPKCQVGPLLIEDSENFQTHCLHDHQLKNVCQLWNIILVKQEIGTKVKMETPHILLKNEQDYSQYDRLIIQAILYNYRDKVEKGFTITSRFVLNLLLVLSLIYQEGQPIFFEQALSDECQGAPVLYFQAFTQIISNPLYCLEITDEQLKNLYHIVHGSDSQLNTQCLRIKRKSQTYWPLNGHEQKLSFIQDYKNFRLLNSFTKLRQLTIEFQRLVEDPLIYLTELKYLKRLKITSFECLKFDFKNVNPELDTLQIICVSSISDPLQILGLNHLLQLRKISFKINQYLSDTPFWHRRNSQNQDQITNVQILDQEALGDQISDIKSLKSLSLLGSMYQDSAMFEPMFFHKLTKLKQIEKLKFFTVQIGDLDWLGSFSQKLKLLQISEPVVAFEGPMLQLLKLFVNLKVLDLSLSCRTTTSEAPLQTFQYLKNLKCLTLYFRSDDDKLEKMDFAWLGFIRRLEKLKYIDIDFQCSEINILTAHLKNINHVKKINLYGELHGEMRIPRCLGTLFQSWTNYFQVKISINDEKLFRLKTIKEQKLRLKEGYFLKAFDEMEQKSTRSD